MLSEKQLKKKGREAWLKCKCKALNSSLIPQTKQNKTKSRGDKTNI
jgi:hypothetical protein